MIDAPNEKKGDQAIQKSNDCHNGFALMPTHDGFIKTTRLCPNLKNDENILGMWIQCEKCGELFVVDFEEPANNVSV
jgi:hypothetical protein